MSSGQKRYEALLALRGAAMPDSVEAEGTSWKRVKTFKHDFFAATGLYQSEKDASLAVLKIFRPYHYYGIPYGLLSLFQASHEEKVYRCLQDTGHVPRWIGRIGKTGIMHEFVPGHDLDYKSPVPEEFFTQLETLIKMMHERGIAYLDTNKPDNVLVGDNGKAYLIDFQISWVQPPFPLSIITAPLFRIFKDSDFYHLLKHKRKFFPSIMSKEEFEAFRPWYLRIHRIIANPVRRIRRDYLRKVEAAAERHTEGGDKH